ncbi:10096_t:CDS:1 [Funneliformis caledonium]|uniref:10096_t:CDS:1 n=1 Tax=Funneliformis caledonium TaxID=1117310 RepID=A0A9N9C0D8_9GLOM|nr:10096_t:CDS:1 [Funneliformis caledonium]
MGLRKTIIRPLGVIERIFQVNHDIDNYYNVGFLIRYKVPITFPFHISKFSITTELKNDILNVLYPTLEQVILDHAELAVCFTDLETSNPKFIRLQKIDLSRLIRFEVINDDKDIETLLEKEHSKKFDVEDQTLPLWRIVVGIKSSKKFDPNDPKNWNLIIGLVWHHSVADGRSSLAFYATFNEFLLKELSKNNPSQLKSVITLPKKSKLPFNKTVEQCLCTRPSLFYLIKEGIKEFVLPTTIKMKLTKGCWLGDTPRFSIPINTTKTFLYSIASKDLKSLVKLSKKHHTTITGLFNVSVLFSAYHHFILASNVDDKLSKNAKKLEPYDSINLCTNINLRPYTTPEVPWTQMGLYASENAHVYKYPRPKNDDKYPELDFWKMSAECREQIIKKGIPDSIERIGITKLIPKGKNAFENTLMKKVNDDIMGREFSISVSNLGKFQKVSSGSKRNSFVNKWKTYDLIFTQSADTFSSGLVISIVSYEKRLTFTISVQAGAVDYKKIVGFGKGIVKCLSTVARNDNVTLQDLA